jgi:hypothetical protein
MLLLPGKLHTGLLLPVSAAASTGVKLAVDVTEQLLSCCCCCCPMWLMLPLTPQL